MTSNLRTLGFRLLSVLMLMFCVLYANAQMTTSSMSGLVTEPNGDPLIAATVIAVHEPSGTRYNALTNIDGRFSIQGMRSGGPYKVNISYVGFKPMTITDITLKLGEDYQLDVKMQDNSTNIDEVVVTAKASKFNNVKTGASTNISSKDMGAIPTVNRSISDIARLSPYANGMSFAGGDGRSTNFTIDGANFNNNFGLSSDLPGGGSPISMDAIEEMQVVIAPFDVRQTNFIGGGINAVTKSGTNKFKGTAYIYYTDQDLRGNRVGGEDLGARAEESKTIYGFTLGGPIVKNKLFFFVNYEYEKTPNQVITYRARQDGETAGGTVSRTLASDMQKVSQYLLNNYGYDTGSWTSFPGDESNKKFLARLDWNITDRHKLSVRYNLTKNLAWNSPNGNSGDTGYRLSGTYRVGSQSMAFANTMYSMENNVSSWSADLNSRFSDKVSNQLLATYTDIKDMRGSNSSVFPFIDIMYEDQLEPYMSAGYELFTYNNGVKNKIFNVTDNATLFFGNHRITTGLSYEHQMANNAYMRNGSGYYRYASLEKVLSGAAPESFALTYGFNGEENPNAQVTFNQIGFYAQDEWNINPKFKLTYGIRLDEIFFDNSDLQTNEAIKDIDFNGRTIDTGKWPDARLQVSPRVGFTWDIFGDSSLKLRGGSGIFTGRLPLVFFTNMPTNANMVQNTVTFTTTYKNGVATSASKYLADFAGNMMTNSKDIINYFNSKYPNETPFPTTLATHTTSSKISGVVSDFKMPQIWKTSLAVDYQLPVSFPFTATAEFMYNKNINAVTIENWNIKNDTENWERFSGADNRLIYPSNYYAGTYQGLYSGTASKAGQTYTGNAVVMSNTSKGYGYTANITLNARPIESLSVMAAYTHTESKEVSGLPGSDPVSTWQGLYTIDGPNFATVQRSSYVLPNKVIASVNWVIPFKHKGLLRNTNLSLFYSGYSSSGNSFYYTNDMNGDGLAYDLMYIPKDDSEINFKTEDDRKAFWAFVEQDSYLKNHKGQYAEAYAARAPWLHRFDFRLMEEFEFKVGKTTHAFQLSFDIMNIGNLFNSKWGVTKTNTVSNSCRILKYEGKNASNEPIFSMYKVNGEYPTQTYDYYQYSSNCWKMQVGVKYLFK